MLWQDYIDLPLEHLGITWHGKTTLIYHLNTLELLGMPKLHLCTTWTLWNYLVWQDYSALPLNTLELHDKITLLYHLNTLELLGMPSLHRSTSWTPWNSIGSKLFADWVDIPGTAALTYLKFLSMTLSYHHLTLGLLSMTSYRSTNLVLLGMTSWVREHLLKDPEQSSLEQHGCHTQVHCQPV